MSATCTQCPACGHPARDNQHEHGPAHAALAIASAISSGEDLGVFKLGETLAKARVAIGNGENLKGLEATRAAVHVQLAHERVAAEFGRLTWRLHRCRACELREQLDLLITCAAEAVRVRESDPRTPATLAACDELAGYAGDDETNASATRAVLELARDVFVAALAHK